MNEFHAAAKMFKENLSMFSAHKDPEKHNLYKGLLNLAMGLQELEDDVRRIKHNM